MLGPNSVVRTKKNENGFTVATVHYSMDPDKQDPEWIKTARQGMSDRAWDREYEISYEVFAGKVFYPEFGEHNLKRVEYQPRETIYRGWDFGFHRPCALITKINQFDQWCWMECILGEDEGIMDFGKRVREHCLTRYPGAYFLDAGDPSGDQMTDKSEKTSVQILEALGIYVRTRRQPRKQGAEIIRQKLKMRVDGKPGLLINPEEDYLVDMMKGGLHYPDVDEGRPQKEFYEKDGYYDHGADAARYIATEMFTVIGEQHLPNDFTSGMTEDPRWKHRMGRPESQVKDHNQIAQIADTIYGESTDLGEFF